MTERCAHDPAACCEDHDGDAVCWKCATADEAPAYRLELRGGAEPIRRRPPRLSPLHPSNYGRPKASNKGLRCKSCVMKEGWRTTRRFAVPGAGYTGARS